MLNKVQSFIIYTLSRVLNKDAASLCEQIEFKVKDGRYCFYIAHLFTEPTQQKIYVEELIKNAFIQEIVVLKGFINITFSEIFLQDVLNQACRQGLGRMASVSFSETLYQKLLLQTGNEELSYKLTFFKYRLELILTSYDVIHEDFESIMVPEALKAFLVEVIYRCNRIEKAHDLSENRINTLNYISNVFNQKYLYETKDQQSLIFYCVAKFIYKSFALNNTE